MPLKKDLLKALEKDRELLEMERQLREQHSSNREIHKWSDPNNSPPSKIEKKSIIQVRESPLNMRPISRRGNRDKPLKIEIPDLRASKVMIKLDPIKQKVVQQDGEKFKDIRREMSKNIERDPPLREKKDVSLIIENNNLFGDDLPDTNELYNDFFNEQLPIVQSEIPNLSLRESRDKIKKMWEISTENPRNNS
jgi:hypothetical protein